MPTLIEQFDPSQILQPIQRPEDARQDALAFDASLTVKKGDLIGVKTSGGKAALYVGVDNVQTVTITGTLSGGTFRVTALKSDGTYVTTDAIAYNANAAAIQSALNAVLGTSAVAVSGTVASHTITFSGTGYTKVNQPLVSVNTGATTGATTSSVADTTTRTGLDTAVAISMYDFATDANGKVYLGSSSATSNIRIGPSQTAPCWTSGIFDPADLKIGNSATTTALVITAFGSKARKLHNGFVKIF